MCFFFFVSFFLSFGPLWFVSNLMAFRLWTFVLRFFSGFFLFFYLFFFFFCYLWRRFSTLYFSIFFFLPLLVVFSPWGPSFYFYMSVSLPLVDCPMTLDFSFFFSVLCLFAVRQGVCLFFREDAPPFCTCAPLPFPRSPFLQLPFLPPSLAPPSPF